MKLRTEDIIESPLPGYAYPVNTDAVAAAFASTLPDSELCVYFTCVELTSDVLIARSMWDSAVDRWGLTVVASRNDELDTIRQAINTEAFRRIKYWFEATNTELHTNPDVWSFHSLTVRFEGETLLYDSRRGERPFKRQPPGWWQNK